MGYSLYVIVAAMLPTQKPEIVIEPSTRIIYQSPSTTPPQKKKVYLRKEKRMPVLLGPPPSQARCRMLILESPEEQSQIRMVEWMERFSTREELPKTKAVSGTELKLHVLEVPQDVDETKLVRFQAAPSYAHGPKYEWLQGQLRYVHFKGGAWTVRYAPLDQVDPYGGSVTLSKTATIAEFQDGDRVRVTGAMIQKRPGAKAIYQVRSIELIERPVEQEQSSR